MTKSVAHHCHFPSLFIKIGLLFSILAEKTLSIGVVVTPDSFIINTVTTYDWKITGLTPNTSSIILMFPSLTSFNGSTVSQVRLWNDTVYTGGHTFSGNNIILTISTFQSNTSMNFKVTNVRNPIYYTSANAGVMKSATQSANYFLIYQMGSILNCSLSFLGATDTTVSTAYLDFYTTNPTAGNQAVFKITYGPYTSINSKIVENGNMTCAYSINGSSSFSSQVSAKNVAGKYQFTCQFPGLALAANSTVKLRFSNARNPPYKNNYFTYPFIVETFEGGAAYDTSSACSLTDVQVDTYKASFTSTSRLINTVYSNPTIESQLQIFKDFQALDKIVVQHNGIQLQRLGTSIFLSRPSSIQPTIQFTVSSGNATTDIVTQSSVSNTNVENRKVVIALTNFDIKVPPSASPLNVTFRFYRNYATNTSVILQYLNIYATLQPIHDTLSIGDLTVIPTSRVIGQPTNYLFRLLISQPLSNQAYILLSLPQQVSIMNNSNVISPCIFASDQSNTVANCTIKDANNKIIQVNINSTSGINVSQTVNITLGLIVNPDNPERTYSFGAETYYKQGDSLSKVQLGQVIFQYTYIERSMNITPVQSFYTVGQNPALLVLQYIPGVKIPANLNIIFLFATSIASSVSYKNVTVDGNTQLIYTATKVGQTITLTVSNLIPANSIVLFKFEFRAPSAVTQYQAVTSVQTKSSSGKLYEISGVLSIQVNQPAYQVFSMTPISSITGVVTNYTLNFFTNIVHTNPFYINIKFPGDVKLKSTLNCNCTPISICKGVIIQSLTTGSQQIYLNITTTNMTSNTFSINITNITNPNYINSTGQFIIKTKTNYTGGLDILSGTATAIIAYPNAANAYLDYTRQYYRMNVQPVQIIATFYNDLVLGDFIRVRFDYRTYVLANAGSAGISCSSGFTCTYDSAESSPPYAIVIKVRPDTSTALAEPIKFSINGLNSSSTTFAGQQFQILIRSYSSNQRQMDQGVFIYKINCTSSPALLSKNCKTCNEPLLECNNCYAGYYLLNKACVSDCANESQYQKFPGSGVCDPCINFCDKCISATQCITCVSGAHLYENSSCIVFCNVDNGFYVATINNQRMCLRCWSNSCIKCVNGSSNGCLNCGSAFMDKGRCLDNCDQTSNYQTITKQCLPCHSRCNGCTGGTQADCKACRPGFFNVSGVCQSSCPIYTVGRTNGTCGCGGSCSKCQIMQTRCVQCLNSSQYLYNYQCIGSCPQSSYDFLGVCKDCSQGCKTCTVTSCVQCLPGYSVYETRCFSQCNTVGERFASVNGVCIQCPDGCDLCNGTLQCSVCLNNYTLVGSVCKKTCQIQNNCVKVSPVPQKIIPVPGVITAGVWLVIIVVLKIFVLKKIYMPYSYIFVSAIIEFILIIAVTAKMNTTIAQLLKNASARLLQNIQNGSAEVPQAHHYSVLGLLAASLAINYISNFIYLFLFVKYLRKYIPDRQIDRISNYLVVAVGVVSNYRFSLMAYSKLFPKPNILVQNQSKLTPLHYMCIASIVTSILPLSAAGILIYNQYALTDLFMLGIDLLIIEVLSLFFTFWMVALDKPQDYFQGTKKYSKHDINNTTQSFNDKQDLNLSKHKLGSAIANMDNSIVHVEQINATQQIYDEKYVRKGANVKSDNQNDPLPNIPVRTSHINIQTMKVKAKQGEQSSQIDNESLQDRKSRKIDHSFSDKKTQRNMKNKTQINRRQIPNTGTGQGKSPQNIGHQAGNHHEVEKGIKSRSKESPKNFSKQRRTTHKKDKNSEDLNIKINQISGKAENNESMFMEQSIHSNETSLNKARSEIVQKQKKPLKAQTQRSSGILPVTMKKKQSFGVFDSQKAESQVDEIDFQSLIQTKMIDKTKDKNKGGPKQQQAQHEEISPSWFNQQNQRFDFQQSSDA